MFEAAFDLRFDLLDAARKMGLLVKGRKLLFDHDAEMDTLSDFYLNDFRPRGKRVVDCYQIGNQAASAEEGELLQALRGARASLFQIEGSDENLCEVYLQDAVDLQQPEVALTDINLSRTARTGDLLFCRLLNVQGIWMSSGNFFPFGAESREMLLQGYKRTVQSLAEPQRGEAAFRFFFEHHRQVGRPREYADLS
jgi:hypothetical protein